MDVQERVRQFVLRHFYVSDPAALADDASLIQAGWVDSTGMLEVITFIEEELGVKVLDAEMLPENLETIARIAAFVARKREAAVAARAVRSA